MLLEVADLHTYYGKSHVLQGVAFGVSPGQITALLGRNGAGKTTTLKSIMGLVPPRQGTIRFDGDDITAQPPHRVFTRGVGYVPEGRQIFPHLDVGENLRLAALSGRTGGPFTPERVADYFPILRERWRQKGKSLSGGEQQMLAVARALAGHPLFLMLDEPSQGLAPLVVRELAALIRRLKDEERLTILLVEQNMRMALAVADHVLVLAKGTLVFSGTIDDFRAREEALRGSYLAV